MERKPNGGARPAAAPRPHYAGNQQTLVAVCVSGFLVRHRTRIALATTCRATLARATGVRILAFPRFLLATGHVFVPGFATVFHVAASLAALVGILRWIQS